MKTLTMIALVMLCATTAAPRADAPRGAVAVAQLNWLAGDWQAADKDGFVQEAWLEPVNGFRSGMFRLFAGERLVVHEYMLIAAEAETVVLRFKHFRADYSTWEQGRAAHL